MNTVHGIILTFVVSLTAAVSPVLAADGVSNRDKLTRSLETWKKLKASCGGNYSYKVGFVSWTGYRNETTIVVRNNTVTKRKFVEAMPKANQTGERWVEGTKELGTHSRAASPRTLDEIYQQADKILATKLNQHQRLNVRVDEKGLVLTCCYVDTRIMDDAPCTGFSLQEITLEGSCRKGR